MNVVERLQGTLSSLGLTAVEPLLKGLLGRPQYLRARLQLAHLPYIKTSDQFDFRFQPSIDERQIRDLRTLRFVHDVSNVIFLGPPDVGKAHLSVALAE